MLNPDQTGFAAQESEGANTVREDLLTGPRAVWLTDELLADTKRVWSEQCRRPFTDREAIEMLYNLKRFADVLLAIDKKGT